MAHEVQRVIYGVASQALAFDVPEGRPSSVTSVTVYDADQGDDGSTESATSGSPSIDSVNTTVDAASGLSQADDRKVNLTATTGIELGRQYLITNAAGETEWVEVTEVAAGDYVRVRTSLANDYAVGATFQGTRITVALSDSWCADTNNLSMPGSAPGYRVRWVYVVSSVTRVRDAYFVLVRYGGDSSVTPADMESFFPGWSDVLPNRHEQDRGSALISDAEREVRMDLVALNRADWSTRNREMTDRLVMYKAVVLLQRARVNLGATQPELLDRAERAYELRLDQLLRTGAQVPIDPDNSGAGQKARPRPISTR